jgi:hypothetical protein
LNEVRQFVGMATSSPLAAMITELEDATWKALQKDGASLIPFLSKDCIMLFPMGMKVSATTDPNLKDVMTSAAFVPWKSYEMSDIEVTSLGEDAAVITYRVKALRQEIDAPDDGVSLERELVRSLGHTEANVKQEPFKALISTTWRKDPEIGAWLMVIHQQTPFTIVGL